MSSCLRSPILQKPGMLWKWHQNVCSCHSVQSSNSMQKQHYKRLFALNNNLTTKLCLRRDFAAKAARKQQQPKQQKQQPLQPETPTTSSSSLLRKPISPALMKTEWGASSSATAGARTLTIKDDKLLPEDEHALNELVEKDELWKQFLPKLVRTARQGRVRAILAILRKYKVTRDDLLSNPNIICYSPASVEHIACTFAECGWSAVTIDMIVHWKTFLQGMTLSDLFASGISTASSSDEKSSSTSIKTTMFSNTTTTTNESGAADETTDVMYAYQVLHAIINQLMWVAGTSPMHRSTILRQVRTWKLDEKTLTDCRNIVLRMLLLSRLPSLDEDFINSKILYIDSDGADCSNSAAVRNLPLMQRMRSRPISDVRRMLDIVQDKLKIPTEKLLNYPIVFSKPADRFEALMATPQFTKYSLDMLAVGRPNLILIPPGNLPELEKIMFEFGISVNQIMSNPMIFRLNVNTLRNRLTVASQVVPFKQFRHDPNYLKLIEYFNSVLPRINALQAYEVLEYPMQLLLCSQEALRQAMQGALSSYPALDSTGAPGRLALSVALVPVARFLQCTCTQAIERLQALNMTPGRELQLMQHHCETVVKMLTELGVTRKQLWNGLSIVLCDAELVAEAIKTIGANAERYRAAAAAVTSKTDETTMRQLTPLLLRATRGDAGCFESVRGYASGKDDADINTITESDVVAMRKSSRGAPVNWDALPQDITTTAAYKRTGIYPAILKHPNFVHLLLCEIARSPRWQQQQPQARKPATKSEEAAAVAEHADWSGGGDADNLQQQQQQIPMEKVAVKKSRQELVIEAHRALTTPGRAEDSINNRLEKQRRPQQKASSSPSSAWLARIATQNIYKSITVTDGESSSLRERIENIGSTVHASVLRKLGTENQLYDDRYFVDLFDVMATAIRRGDAVYAAAKQAQEREQILQRIATAYGGEVANALISAKPLSARQSEMLASPTSTSVKKRRMRLTGMHVDEVDAYDNVDEEDERAEK